MKITALCLTLLLAFSCSNKDKKADPFVTEFDTIFTNMITDDGPGGCILVQKNYQTQYLKSFGIADLKTGEKITKNTVFNTGSISKTFVSNAILILEQEGQLSIDNNIGKFFNDFDNKEIANQVTLRHLLAHTSGLPDLRDVGENIEFFMTARDTENFEPLKRTEVLNFQPGEHFEYSNPAFNGLALIINQLTNQKWQNFIQSRIFEPAGMTSSKITDGAFPDVGVAHAYWINEGQYEEYDYGEFSTFAASGNGGIWSTVLELAQYEKALDEGKILNEAQLIKSRTVIEPANWADSTKPFIGCSWFIGEKALLGTENDYGHEIVYHTGSQGGFKAFYITIPEKRISYIALFNYPVKEYSEIIQKGLDLIKKHDWLD